MWARICSLAGLHLLTPHQSPILFSLPCLSLNSLKIYRLLSNSLLSHSFQTPSPLLVLLISNSSNVVLSSLRYFSLTSFLKPPRTSSSSQSYSSLKWFLKPPRMVFYLSILRSTISSNDVSSSLAKNLRGGVGCSLGSGSSLGVREAVFESFFFHFCK